MKPYGMRRQDYGSNCPCCDQDQDEGRHGRARREAREDLRERVRTVMAERIRARGVTLPPDPQPRYDAEFFEGVAWLDSL